MPLNWIDDITRRTIKPQSFGGLKSIIIDRRSKNEDRSWTVLKKITTKEQELNILNKYNVKHHLGESLIGFWIPYESETVEIPKGSFKKVTPIGIISDGALIHQQSDGYVNGNTAYVPTQAIEYIKSEVNSVMDTDLWRIMKKREFSKGE